jgi:hypothetical protein
MMKRQKAGVAQNAQRTQTKQDDTIFPFGVPDVPAGKSLFCGIIKNAHD